MRYVDEGIELLELAAFVDKQKTGFARAVYDRSGYPIGHEMRRIVERLCGEWGCLFRPRGQFDTVNIPFRNGILVIERPWLNHDDTSYTGHRVSFVGELTEDFVQVAKQFLTQIHEEERMRSKEWFLSYATHLPQSERQEIAALF